MGDAAEMGCRAFSDPNLPRPGDLIAWLALLVSAILAWGRQQGADQVFQGYAEGEFVLVAAFLAVALSIGLKRFRRTLD